MDSANGRLYTGRDRNNRDVVIKQIPRAKVSNWATFDGAIVPSEIYYHFRAASFDTEGVIIKPIVWFEKKSSFVLIMERLQHSCDLFDLTKKYGKLADGAAQVIFSRVLKMVETLNRAGIAHRDIKDENIVVDQSTLEVKLIDFGCATALTKCTETEFSGTPEFYPPEFWRSRSYTHEALNTWSCGVVLYILLNGGLPYASVDDIAFYRVEADQNVKRNSPKAQKILCQALQGFSSKRISLPSLKTLVDQWQD